MEMTSAAPSAPAALTHHKFTFEGRGGEYFKIWIVNLVLSILTLGIFSAWAKVRSKRYFYGNTHVGGHSFEYHASPWRILLGRVIAVCLLLGYTLSDYISPVAILGWFVVFIIAVPWLVVSSLRFNARNSSYRNVRFHFHGTYGQAFKVMFLWPLLAVITLYTTLPLAQRAHSYFYVNNHTFGGEEFRTQFSGAKIYMIYALCFLPIIAVIVAGFVFLAPVMEALPKDDPAAAIAALAPLIPFFLAGYLFLIFAMIALGVLVFNLTINNMKLSGRHEFRSTMSPLAVIWIGVSNLFLIAITLGLAYPWAHIRMTRYQVEHLDLLAASDMSEFSSEGAAGTSAIGEEISSFFDLDFGL